MKTWMEAILCASLLMMSSTGFAQTDTSTLYTLKQCIETGIAKNLTVQQSNLQMQADEIGWNQAKLNLLPSVNGSIGHGVNQGRSIDPFTNGYVNEKVNYANYSLSGSVVLFNGLSLQNSIKQNSLSYQASRMDWQQQKDNLTINIILAYLQVLNNEDLLDLAKRRLELTRQSVSRQEELNAAGAIAPPVLTDLKGQLADDQISLISSEQSLEASKLNLCSYMNIPYSKSMKLEKIEEGAFAAIYPDQPDQIYALALEHFALVKSVELKKESAVKGVKVRQGQLYPTLSLGADAYSNYSSAAMQNTFLSSTPVPSDEYVDVNGTQYPVIKQQSNFKTDKISYSKQLNNNIATSIGLTLRVPIFNSLRSRNQVKLARLTLKNTELVEQSTKIQLRQSIDEAYINMQTAFNRYKATVQQVEAYTQSFNAASVKFDSGVGTSIDYLIVKNNMERANINLITAKYDYLLRTKILDYYQGKQSW